MKRSFPKRTLSLKSRFKKRKKVKSTKKKVRKPVKRKKPIKKKPVKRKASIAKKKKAHLQVPLPEIAVGWPKISDTGPPAGGGRLERERKNHFVKLVIKQRIACAKISSKFHSLNPAVVISHFKLRGMEFGRWVNQQAAINFLAGALASMLDLSKALKFKDSQIGLRGTLTLSFGARGHGGKALAHYEPLSKAINLTRYPRGTGVNQSPGLGALAHEWGHALDNFLCKVTGSGGIYLSGGNSLRYQVESSVLKSDSLSGSMERLMKAIIYDRGKTPSPFYMNLRKNGKSYWYQRNELFARTFEQYVHFKLSKSKCSNTFLTFAKYDNAAYLPPAHFKRVVPFMDDLIKRAKTRI